MKENENFEEELMIKRQQIAEWKAKITHLDAQIEEEKKRNEQLIRKRNDIVSQFAAMKQSKVWKVLRRFKKFLWNIWQITSGKRKWHQLYQRSTKQKSAERRLKRLRYSLYDLGFIKKALADLEDIFFKTDNQYLKRLVAWELALWHANQYKKEDANKCLKYLSEAVKGERSRDFLRRKTILEAECYTLLGQTDKAKHSITKALATEEHGDLYLAAANLETSPEDRVKWINKALQLYGMSKITFKIPGNQTAYDGLGSEHMIEHGISNSEEKTTVSVIMPVYNAEKVIRTSIESILAQTWSNIELLVVDDCSDDATVTIVKEYEKKDTRVRLIKAKTNGGAYKARNLALREAAGEFVTINDADDWSHPEKLSTQAVHLLDNPNVIANTTQQARATEELQFHRRGKPGSYLFANLSSLMFRRKQVMNALGYWDEVRFGADGEFKRRLKIVFGDEAVVDLNTGPYSFQRQSSSSLTGNQAFGYHGFFMGARKEYHDSYTYFHKTSAPTDLRYEIKQVSRPFAVPEPMLPTREKKQPDGRRHFDIIIASDFRLLGGTNMSNIEEVKAHKRMGLRTGLIQMARYDFYSEKQINPNIRKLIDGDQVQMLVYGEKISCDVLIVRHPPVLQEWQKYIPDVEAHSINVIVNQPPKREYSENGKVLYDFYHCAENLKQYFGKQGKWFPIGPLVRETLYEHHAKELKGIKLGFEDWVNIIDVDEWKRQERPPRRAKIIIGRHSRSQYVKWPADREQLQMIYPESDDYEIHVLGGASVPEEMLGRLPSNWHVKEFGELHPRDFLAELDVFVYYTHPDWVEAFGRVIFEAMAAGVPVIIPPSYMELFGEAAIYAEPHEVKEKIAQLMADDSFYTSQVERAFVYVEKHFGYTKHAERLKEQMLDKNTSIVE
ncbi:Glycosyl transferases group 1 [Evansella caseinilytica]|uniref:Glycosyl transferases group 1 n=1 Tax=Evansella caseinilytica TaxID=1503961 RepID=A0A1H3TZD2_9BACI|nr:glycosyltransferase [Evansella caseinilytica]SDZ55570.1 Glycosyl transferases group 1 [Evansella caseinilytica]